MQRSSLVRLMEEERNDSAFEIVLFVGWCGHSSQIIPGSCYLPVLFAYSAG
jgi:hypothetical protein